MKKLFALSIALFPLWTLAHVGHGIVKTGPAHFLLAAEHFIPILVLFVGVVYYLARKKKSHA